MRAVSALGAGIVLLAVMLAAASAAVAKPDALTLTAPQDIKVRARQVTSFDGREPERRQFGKLEFLGGLSLTSSASHFGGFSGIAVDPDGGDFMAVSDAGFWLRGRFQYDQGRISGVENAVVGALRAKSGKALVRDDDRDAESVALVKGRIAEGEMLIAFERNHRIGLFKSSKDGIGAPESYLRLPGYVKSLESNLGIEAVTMLQGKARKGTIVAFAESRRDNRGHIRGWLLGKKSSAEIFLTSIGGFSITDAAPLPGGDLLILERRFRWSEGVKMRIRRIKAAAIKPGAVLAGEILFEADQRYDIDNMEGLTLHQAADGATILTLISDDNFSFFQRNLVLQFKLAE